MDYNELEQRVAILEQEVSRLKEIINIDNHKIDCGYWDNEEG